MTNITELNRDINKCPLLDTELSADIKAREPFWRGTNSCRIQMMKEDLDRPGKREGGGYREGGGADPRIQ